VELQCIAVLKWGGDFPEFSEVSWETFGTDWFEAASWLAARVRGQIAGRCGSRATVCIYIHYIAIFVKASF
jgi:hypothetical protein